MPRLERLLAEPLIHPGLHPRIGDNINGPSLIRVPDWVENRLGRYHLYFAHHMGTHIRMAYSDALGGPWRIHAPGVLDVAQSLFEAADLPEPEVAVEEDLSLYAHVASPDVHIDHEKRQIRMYFHGLLADADQQTRVATSRDGLSFEALAPLLGPPYFRVFAHGGWVYAIAWGGALLRAKGWEGPFEAGPPLLTSSPVAVAGQIIRHVAVLCRGDRLELFYSCIGDEPECILHRSIGLSADWADWKAGVPTVVLRPELTWEGADLPPVRSRIGAADGREHALRDPCIYCEGDRIYLLYSGAGESGIGLAEVLDL